MPTHRLPLHGLFAVLLALMAQLGAGMSVPRIDPITGLAVLCRHAPDTGGSPSKPPSRSTDCLLCPLCIALHAPSALLVPDPVSPLPRVLAVAVNPAMPPPATAPPALHRPPSQPRAPPAFS